MKCEFDQKLENLLSDYRVTVLQSDVDKAAQKALTYTDRPNSPPRDAAKKFADALMEIAERPLCEIGGIDAPKYRDVDCPEESEIIPGLVEVKTANSWTHADHISGTYYKWMLILDRDFTTESLAQQVRDFGIDSVLGMEFHFHPRAIYKFCNGLKVLSRSFT